MKCGTFLCERKVPEGWATCESCLQRLLTGAFAPAESRLPLWVQRARAGRLVPKDFTFAA
jgi:hypothetical protein